MAEQLTSRRPYLLRATYEWLADNYLTPYILVSAAVEGVRVPAHTVQDGQVVLNIGMNAVKELELGNEAVSFQARFAGKVESIYIPLPAVIAIYARENQQGMVLPTDEALSSQGQEEGAKPEAAILPASQGQSEEGRASIEVLPKGSEEQVASDAPQKRPGLSIVK